MEINSTVNSSTPNGTVLINYANVTSDTSPFGVVSNTVTNNVETRASLNINKTAPASVVAGQSAPMQFTLHIWNNGPSDAGDVVLTDLVDLSRLYGVQYSLNGSPWAAWIGSLPMGTVIAGSSFDILMQGYVNASALGYVNNTANLTTDTPNDGNLTSNSTTQINTYADLNLNKTVNPQNTVIAGNNLLFTLTLTNIGPSVARDLVFHDNLSNRLINAQYRYRLNNNAWNSWFTFNGSFVIDIITGYLRVGDNVTIEINSTVNSTTPNGTVIYNTANVTSSTDPSGTESPTIDTTVITRAELVITKVADVEKIGRGRPIHYTITITNIGPSDALNVNFYDNFDPKMLLNTYYSTSTGIPWTAFTGPLNLTNLLLHLAPRSSIMIWIKGTVSPDASQNLTNTVVANSETDPTGNRTAQVTTPIQTSDVAIQKTVSNPRPYIHETIHFTLIVQNRGPDTAVDVYVVDKLPSGVRYVSSRANYGSYDPVTGIWTIGNLTRDTIAELVITVVVEKLGPLENHAYVYTASYDPILDDSNATATLEVLPRPEPVHGKTVGIQKTGVPLPLLALAVLMLLAGLVKTKRNR